MDGNPRFCTAKCTRSLLCVAPSEMRQPTSTRSSTLASGAASPPSARPAVVNVAMGCAAVSPFCECQYLSRRPTRAYHPLEIGAIDPKCPHQGFLIPTMRSPCFICDNPVLRMHPYAPSTQCSRARSVRRQSCRRFASHLIRDPTPCSHYEVAVQSLMTRRTGELHRSYPIQSRSWPRLLVHLLFIRALHHQLRQLTLWCKICTTMPRRRL